MNHLHIQQAQFLPSLFQERLSSLKAGLLTWQDHLNRLERLSKEFEVTRQTVEESFEDADKHLKTPLPTENEKINEDLRLCQVFFHNLIKNSIHEINISFSSS